MKFGDMVGMALRYASSGLDLMIWMQIPRPMLSGDGAHS
jgi:hypothetical protein